MPNFKYSAKNLRTRSLMWGMLYVLCLSACQSAPPPPATRDATLDAAMTEVMAAVATIGAGTAAPTAQASPTDLSLSPTVVTPTATVTTHTPDPLPSATAQTAVSATPTRLVVTRPPAATPPPAPEIFFFTASPAEIDPHEPVTVTWSAQGERAVLGTLDHRGRLGISYQVPLSGTFVFTDTWLSSGRNFLVYLYISTGAQYTSTGLLVPVRCPATYAWFFANPPALCASGPPRATPIQAQTFEHGLMLWTQYNDYIYVLYGEGDEYALMPNSWFEGMPVDDPTLTPPPGLFQPVRGFGVAWRTGNYGQSFQSVLGWATGPEFSVSNGAYQCDSASYATCYLSGPNGVVYRLLPERSGWEVWTP